MSHKGLRAKLTIVDLLDITPRDATNETIRYKMKGASLLALSLTGFLHGGDLTVFTSAKAYEDDFVSASIWYSDGSWIDKEPETTVVQEGQIIREVYRDLKPGKYRITLNSLGAIEFSEALMETHVSLKKESSESVIIIAQEGGKLEIPKELEDAFKKFEGKVLWDLSVRYPGFEKKFHQVREFSDSKDFRKSIHYLRPDGEYTISIMDKALATKGDAYEKTFRVGKKRESEQDGADQPASATESKAAGKDNPKAESEAAPR